MSLHGVSQSPVTDLADSQFRVLVYKAPQPKKVEVQGEWLTAAASPNTHQTIQGSRSLPKLPRIVNDADITKHHRVGAGELFPRRRRTKTTATSSAPQGGMFGPVRKQRREFISAVEEYTRMDSHHSRPRSLIDAFVTSFREERHLFHSRTVFATTKLDEAAQLAATGLMPGEVLAAVCAHLLLHEAMAGGPLAARRDALVVTLRAVFCLPHAEKGTFKKAKKISLLQTKQLFRNDATESGGASLRQERILSRGRREARALAVYFKRFVEDPGGTAEEPEGGLEAMVETPTWAGIRPTLESRMDAERAQEGLVESRLVALGREVELISTLVEHMCDRCNWTIVAVIFARWRTCRQAARRALGVAAQRFCSTAKARLDAPRRHFYAWRTYALERRAVDPRERLEEARARHADLKRRFEDQQRTNDALDRALNRAALDRRAMDHKLKALEEGSTVPEFQAAALNATTRSLCAALESTLAGCKAISAKLTRTDFNTPTVDPFDLVRLDPDPALEYAFATWAPGIVDDRKNNNNNNNNNADGNDIIAECHPLTAVSSAVQAHNAELALTSSSSSRSASSPKTVTSSRTDGSSPVKSPIRSSVRRVKRGASASDTSTPPHNHHPPITLMQGTTAKTETGPSPFDLACGKIVLAWVNRLLAKDAYERRDARGAVTKLDGRVDDKLAVLKSVANGATFAALARQLHKQHAVVPAPQLFRLSEAIATASHSADVAPAAAYASLCVLRGGAFFRPAAGRYLNLDHLVGPVIAREFWTSREKELKLRSAAAAFQDAGDSKNNKNKNNSEGPTDDGSLTVPCESGLAPPSKTEQQMAAVKRAARAEGQLAVKSVLQQQQQQRQLRAGTKGGAPPPTNNKPERQGDLVIRVVGRYLGKRVVVDPQKHAVACLYALFAELFATHGLRPSHDLESVHRSLVAMGSAKMSHEDALDVIDDCLQHGYRFYDHTGQTKAPHHHHRKQQHGPMHLDAAAGAEASWRPSELVPAVAEQFDSAMRRVAAIGEIGYEESASTFEELARHREALDLEDSVFDALDDASMHNLAVTRRRRRTTEAIDACTRLSWRSLCTTVLGQRIRVEEDVDDGSFTRLRGGQMREVFKKAGLTTEEEFDHELEELAQLFRGWLRDVKRVYLFYASAGDTTSSSGRLGQHEYWRLIRDCKLQDRQRKYLPSSVVDVMYQTAIHVRQPDPAPGSHDVLAPQQANNNNNTDDNDSGIGRIEFSEILTMLACARYPKAGLPRNRLKRVMQDHILPYAGQVDADIFRDRLGSANVKSMLAKHRKVLRIIFGTFGSAVGGTTTLASDDLVQMMRDAKVVGPLLSESYVRSIFAYVQNEIDALEEKRGAGGAPRVVTAKAASATQKDHDEQMVFSEFQEAVAAVAAMLEPDPYKQLDQSIDRFVHDRLIPPLAAHYPALRITIGKFLQQQALLEASGPTAAGGGPPP